MNIKEKFKEWNSKQNFSVTNLLAKFLEKKIELTTPNIAIASYDDRSKSYEAGYKESQIDTLKKIQNILLPDVDENSGYEFEEACEFIAVELKKAGK